MGKNSPFFFLIAAFSTSGYKKSEIAQKYPWYIANNDLDARNHLPEDDIVQRNWGEGWCIPTAKDFQLLIDNTTIKTETINGKTWVRVTGKNDYSGNSILIPATGYIDDAANTENGVQRFTCRAAPLVRAQLSQYNMP